MKIVFDNRTLLILIVTLLWVSCKEIPPGVNFNPSLSSADTISVPIPPQQRNVLLESITGVRCVNCPGGDVVAAGIAYTYPDRLSFVDIHAGSFAVTYTYSNQDFRTQNGTDIYNYLGGSSQYPCADIDRVGPQNNKFITPASSWIGHVNAALQDTTPVVKIGLLPSYDPLTRKLNLAVGLLYTQTESTTNNLSVMITESGMIDAQEVPIYIKPHGIDTFYVHRHVLRGMLTPSLGQPVDGNKAPGKAINFVLPAYFIPQNWNTDSCNIIVFVTQGTDSVLQVVQTPLKK